MALTRLEKALSLQNIKVPDYFEHQQVLGKPLEPSIGALDTSDTQRYQLWKANRENGTVLGIENKNPSPALSTAIVNYEGYLTSPAYKNWSAIDIASREMQWRFLLVDTAEAVNTKATLSPTQSSTGTGASPIAVTDVGVLGGDKIIAPPEYVTTGDPNNPEMVFGDDGDIVTVQ